MKDKTSCRGLHHSIFLSHFDHGQNYLEIEGKVKIILKKDGNEIIINHKEKRMVKDGED